MEAARAIGALSTLAARGPLDLSSEEVKELQRLALVQLVSSEERDALGSSSAALEAATVRVRDLQRTRDLAHGARKPGPARVDPDVHRSGKTNAQDPLRAALEDLETRSLAKSALSAQVPNPTTGAWLTLTLEGRQTLRDLEVWRPRLSSGSLAELLAFVGDLRRRSREHVESAVRWTEGEAELHGDPPPRGGTESLRSSALLLGFDTGSGAAAERGPRVTSLDLRRLEEELASRLSDASLVELTATLVLFGGESGEGAVARLFSLEATWEERSALVRAWPLPERALFSSLMARAPEDPRGALADRLVSFAPLLGEGTPLSLAAGILSDREPTEWDRRRRAGVDALARLGYGPGPRVADAAGLLASSRMSDEDISARPASLDPEVRSRFPDPCVAGVLLASLAPTVGQSLALLSYARAAIAQASFFGDTLEVDHQALLLAFSMSGRPQLQGAWAQKFLPLAYAYHGLWLHRSLLEAVRQHPVHDHSVPVYG